MRDNATTNWARGLKFVQWSKNNRHHSGIKATPYSALFSHEPQLGLRGTTIPTHLIDQINTEEELEAATSAHIQTGETTASVDDQEPTSTHHQHGTSFDLGVNIPISDVGSVLESADTESDESDIDDHNGDESNIFNILAKSGIYSELNCPFCCSVFVGKTQCSGCQTYCHETPSCSVVEGEARYCLVCARKNVAAKKRKECESNLEKQAAKMIDASNKRFKPAQMGDHVLVPIPDVDKGRSDFRNIRGIVRGVNGDGCYTIGTEHGILKQAYTRNQFMPTNSVSVFQIPEKYVSLREAARGDSIGGGQGYDRCNCKTGCNSNRCSCVKNDKLCHSKCHNSLTCSNK